MKTKQRIANEIVVFFKSFLYSIPISGIFFGFLYFFVFDIQYFKDPRIDGIFNPIIDWQYSQYGYSIRANAFGGLKNMKAYNEYYSTLPIDKSQMFHRVTDSCRYWVRDKTKESIVFSIYFFFAIPFIVIISRLFFRSIKHSYKWIQTNKPK